ncbi:MAG: hypothetical protein JST82_12365 [Bacteroidetes bacterium]|nr:hypothetical protein [Bacteroidota bacterium]
MKTKFTLLSLIIIIFAACNNGDAPPQTSDTAAAPKMMFAEADTTTDTCTSCIPKDSANKMISSYITSLNGNPDDVNLYSLIIDADQLRLYLSNTNIKHVKLMLAHTLEYINSGHSGQNCGYKSGALTLIIAGYDASNNYVYYDANMVMDHMLPCPSSCPSSGTAANNTF